MTPSQQFSHTPSPWHWDGDDLWHRGKDYNDATDPHQYTGIKSDTRLRESKTLDANRLLIAAAPELLEAAQTILDDLHARIDEISKAGQPVPVFRGIAALHDAIAKATKGT